MLEDTRLGRVAPQDWRHVEKYPLAALDIAERPAGIPVGIGVNWYRNFYADKLIQRGTDWWVPEEDFGRRVGGHALTLEPFAPGRKDIASWHRWHNQVSEGICVGEMVCRVMAIHNRKRYQPRPVYDIAQTIDYWEGEDYSGTSANAGFAVARTHGMVPAKRGEPQALLKGEITRPFVPEAGISATRWARNDIEVFEALGKPDAQYAIWLNSWGTDYPWRVKVPRSVIARLLAEDGEFGIVTDR